MLVLRLRLDYSIVGNEPLLCLQGYTVDEVSLPAFRLRVIPVGRGSVILIGLLLVGVLPWNDARFSDRASKQEEATQK